MKERFTDTAFNDDQMKLIRWADQLLTVTYHKGYQMTLRQLYYQGVSQNLYENSKREYDRLGDIISSARMAGFIDWAMIVDLGRNTHCPNFEESAKQVMIDATKRFRTDKWEDQPNYLEAVIEKQALEGVISPICYDNEVRFTSAKGYGSATFLYDLGKRIHERRAAGKQVHILYGGDHDASGIDMTRDLRERLTLFSDGPVYVHRITLNMNQVEAFRLPENKLKKKDPRAGAYREKYGNASWEMDALPVETLSRIFEDSIKAFRNEDIWAKSMEYQETQREILEGLTPQ